MLIVLGVQIIGFGLVGEIIIYTQAQEPEANTGSSASTNDDCDRDRDSAGAGPDGRRPAAIGFVSSALRRALSSTRPCRGARVDGARLRARSQPDLLALRAGDELVGVLPMMSLPVASSAGRNLVSMPYGVYGGRFGHRRGRSSRDSWSRRPVRHADRAERVGHLELRYDAGDPRSATWRARTSTGPFVCELPAEAGGRAQARCPKKSRAEARKARDKHGLELVRGRLVRR